MIDHETAAVLRIPNSATLDVWHTLVTDCWYWSANAITEQRPTTYISEAVYKAHNEGALAFAGADLPAVDWRQLHTALKRWHARAGWRTTRDY